MCVLPPSRQFGQDGDDMLHGGPDDVLYGGASADRLDGMFGVDLCSLGRRAYVDVMP